MGKDDYELGDNDKKIANWVNVTLRRGLESGSLKRAAVEGRKGAGSFKLGDNPTAETSSKKVTETAKSKMKSSAKRSLLALPVMLRNPRLKKKLQEPLRKPLQLNLSL